jgi:dTDP-4-dehydrorhamnose reductase
MRVLLLGSGGLLGQAQREALTSEGVDVVAPSRSELNIVDPVSVAQIVAGTFGSIDWLMNCAAYTAVDQAETEVQLATEVNAIAPGYLSSAAQMIGARMLHFSTDFVFDGELGRAYREDDVPNPLGAYGKSKLAGEQSVLAAHPDAIVVRVAWLFGPHGPNFVASILRAAEAGKPLRVVDDQTGTPTYTRNVALQTVEILRRSLPGGVYHLAGLEPMTWHGLATIAVDHWAANPFRQAPSIEKIATWEWPTAAIRPRNSSLDSQKLVNLGIVPAFNIAESMADYVKLTSTG